MNLAALAGNLNKNKARTAPPSSKIIWTHKLSANSLHLSVGLTLFITSNPLVSLKICGAPISDDCARPAIESAALAEKLLNDLLKTTEGFQRLKKMNDELKQAGPDKDSKYVS